MLLSSPVVSIKVMVANQTYEQKLAGACVSALGKPAIDIIVVKDGCPESVNIIRNNVESLALTEPTVAMQDEADQNLADVENKNFTRNLRRAAAGTLVPLGVGL